MSDMLAFMLGMIDGIADFLGTAPIIYIVGFLLAAIIVRIMKDIINIRG